MISATELAAMQATVNSALDLSIVIQRATPTSDSAGGQSVVWNTIATVNGNLAEPDAGLMQNYDYLIGTESSTLVRVAVGTNVLENDRLQVGSRTLRVQVILQPMSYQTGLLLITAEVK